MFVYLFFFYLNFQNNILVLQFDKKLNKYSMNLFLYEYKNAKPAFLLHL